MVGLGLLAPLLTGAPLGAALGVTLGGHTKKQLMVWMSAGIVLWAVILTVATYWGPAGIKQIL